MIMVIVFWVVTVLVGLAVLGGIITLTDKFNFITFLVWLAMCFVLVIFVFILKDGQYILK